MIESQIFLFKKKKKSNKALNIKTEKIECK